MNRNLPLQPGLDLLSDTQSSCQRCAGISRYPFSIHRGSPQDIWATSRACKQNLEGSLTKDQLIDTTVKLGFNNVIDAFHVVNQQEIPVRFYADERKSSRKGIRVCDELFKLKQEFQAKNLPNETEARWRLVETANRS